MYKLKAGALQYTIFVSVLILLLVSAFISLVYLQQKTRIKTAFFQETIHQSNMGFDYLAAHQIAYNQELNISFNSEFENSTVLSKKQWGFFDLVTSQSKIKNEFFEKIAIMSGHQSQKEALYLKDNNKPLVLVGNTEIRGQVAIPKQGVRRGNIAGNSYYGSQLIYGNTRLSNSQLPKIVNRNDIIQLANGNFLNDQMQSFNLEEGLKKVNSFNKPTQFFISTDAINLQFIELTGNIIIQSYTKIYVSKSAQLKDVILIAPQIEINNNVSGNFQAFATEQMVVGENCNLQYPTALCLVENNRSLSEVEVTNQQLTNSQITIGSETVVKGAIVFLSGVAENNYKPQILLEENSTIVGEVYCDKNIELKGTVKGMVYTDAFVALQSGSVYINHIFNGRIIEPELPEQYCGLQFQKTQNNVVKWLY